MADPRFGEDLSESPLWQCSGFSDKYKFAITNTRRLRYGYDNQS